MTIDAPQAQASDELAARQLVDRAKARPSEGLEEAARWLTSEVALDVVAAHWARGAALYELGQNDEALVELHQAVDEGPDQLNGWVAITLAAAESAAGRQDHAVERLTTLMTDNRRDLAVLATAQLGLIRLHQGRVRESLSLLVDSAEDLRGLPDMRVSRARALGNAGYCGLLLGEVRAAEQHFNEAMALATETDQLFMAGGLRQNLAYVRMCLGDLPVAIASYRDAIDVYHETGRPGRAMVAVYDDLAEAYRFAGLTRDAVRYARLSVWTARQHSNVEGRADSLYRYAQCLFDHESFAAAATAAGQAAELFAGTGRELWAVRSELVAIAAAIEVDELDADSDTEIAQETYQSRTDADHPLIGDPETSDAERLTSIASRLDDLGSTAEATKARNLAAELLIAQGDERMAQEILASRSSDGTEARTDHTIDNLERLYGQALFFRLNGESLQPVLNEARIRLQNLLRGLADAELRNGVVGLSSRFRAMALDEVLTNDADPRDILRTEEAWRFTQQPTSGHVANEGEDDEISAHLGQLRLLYRQRRRKDALDDELESRINELEAEIRELSMAVSTDEAVPPAFSPAISPPVEPPKPSADGDATDWLDDSDAMLVQLFEHDGEIHTVGVVGDSSVHQLVGTRGELDAQVSTIRTSIGRLLRSRASSSTSVVLWDAVRADAQALGQRLFGPVEPGRAVVISCPPGFAPLPWSLLVDESCPVSVIAGASVWQAEPPRIPTDDVAVIVGPDLDHAGDDGRAVTDVVPAAAIIGGDEAGCADLLEALATNSVVHVAAHSHFRPDSVMFSSLQMADGPLPVYELARLVRAPKLVVLAACEAGGTGGTDFGQWLGLMPELLRRGTECLVAPVRPIVDADAAEVMRHFYRHLPNTSVAEALARTRADVASASPRLQAAAHAFLAFGRGHAVLA